jgi:hypothetical protein
VRKWARGRVPDALADEMRVEVEAHGTTITVVERRPPSHPGLGPDWTRQRIAQLRFDPGASVWTLWHSDSHQRWHPYDLPAQSDVQVLLDEMDGDPVAVFWG